jgi:hypothetical protein
VFCRCRVLLLLCIIAMLVAVCVCGYYSVWLSLCVCGYRYVWLSLRWLSSCGYRNVWPSSCGHRSHRRAAASLPAFTTAATTTVRAPWLPPHHHHRHRHCHLPCATATAMCVCLCVCVCSYASNLDPFLPEPTLRRRFEQHGVVTRCTRPLDPATNAGRVYAFVELRGGGVGSMVG